MKLQIPSLIRIVVFFSTFSGFLMTLSSTPKDMRPGRISTQSRHGLLMSLIRAALAYVGVIFALGFVCGVVRNLFVISFFGPVAAVAVELPVMLSASWAWSKHRIVPQNFTFLQSLVVGTVAFALLMLCELAVSMGILHRDLNAHIAAYAQPEAQLGLLGQVGFALIPAILRVSSGALPIFLFLFLLQWDIFASSNLEGHYFQPLFFS
jgi:hypothetical protein